MGVREGYKQTEVGVIPNEWGAAPLRDECQLITKGTTPTSLGRGFTSYGVSFVKVESVGKSGDIIPNKVAYIDEYTHELLSRSKLKSGDILFSIAGALGRVAIVSDEILPANTNQAFSISRLANYSVLRVRFLYQYFNSNDFIKFIESISVQGAQPNLSLADVGDFIVPAPPLPEQRAIAAALSDADELIAGLEAQVAKKRAIKQGAMQQLLTGRKRLPGFTGEWEEKRLGDVGRTYGGLTGKSKQDFSDGNKRYITFMNVMSNIQIKPDEFEWVKMNISESQNTCVSGDLIFNTSSETPEELAMCSLLSSNNGELYLNSFCFGFRLSSDSVDGLYLTYYFRNAPGRDLIHALAQGATRYNISKANFLKLIIFLPPFLEQQAIAAVLSDMDTEIESLQTQLGKTRALKQGMMQELLTGRIRLV